MAGQTTDLIKQKLDIVDFLRGYLTLQPAGKNFKALCPFHKEKSPSFSVSPDRQTWHCFGCSLGGDIFAFLMRYENIDFGDALKVLAEKAGVELKRLNPTEYKYLGLLYDLNDQAKEFFKGQLAASEPAQAYLASRGLASETIATFEIGWAPPGPEALTQFFLKAGHAPDDIIRSGLVFKTDRGSRIDRFRARIMFPIHNHLGKVVGFTGRVLPQFDGSTSSPPATVAKYVNSPETPIFNKSKVLYGLWKSRNAIRDAGKAFLVEGQMDYLMSYQAGIPYAVASSGTALTADHLRMIRRLAPELIVSFDNDSAGAEAGERAIDLAEAADFQVKVISLGSYKDPGEMAEKEPEALKRAVEAAEPAAEFYFRKYLTGEPVNFRDRKSLERVRAVLRKIARMASPVERDYWMRELAKRLGVGERVLREEADHIPAPALAPPKPEGAGGSRPDSSETKPDLSRRELLAQELIGAAIVRSDFSIIESAREHLPEPYSALADLLRDGVRSSPDPATDELLNFIILRSAPLDDAEVKAVQGYLLSEYVHDRRRALTELVRRLEAGGDEAELEKALAELRELPNV